ncbi:(Fe-S)-binding protein [Spirochaetia bacterium]|nr:(Fe-S)-binding protein [Spirochaetia bacterium]
MVRKIITIDREKCNGCGLCAKACHEGAIGIIEGKARLLRDDYCDGLGNCLPVCPANAITFEEREAKEYNEEAVKMNMNEKTGGKPLACGCPGSNAKTIKRTEGSQDSAAAAVPVGKTQSQLNQWPVQIKLVPINAPYFEGANLLVSADCAAYAYGNFHNDFMKNKIVLIGCPKLDHSTEPRRGEGSPLDEGDYSKKLTEIISQNNIKSVTVVRMEVPCCGGIEQAVKNALQNSGKMLPWQAVTISISGEILD